MSYEVKSLSVRGAKAEEKERVNEDTILIDNPLGIYLVADGLGGHAGGSMASRLAVSLVHQELSEFYSMLKDNSSLTDDIPEMLEQILGLADEFISLAGNAGQVNSIKKELDKTDIPNYPLLEQYYPNMGTTIDVVMLHDNTAYIGHVGNGRIYKFSETRMHQITQEHVTAYSDKRKMIYDGWVLHERTMGLANYIGMRGDPADIHTEEIRNGEGLLLMTDGFSHVLSISELIHAIRDWDNAESNMEKIARHPGEIPKLYSAWMGVSLEEAQKKYDGMDNASFIAIRRSD